MALTLESCLTLGLIFDFDGTLIDSYEAIAESLNRVRESFSLPPLPPAEIKTMVGHGLEHLIQKAIGGERVEEGVKLFRQSYATLCEKRTSILPQVKETLEELDRRGYRMAIATNKPSYFARDILRALEIEHLFAEVLGPNDVERPKPDPEMLEIIMMRIGLSPEEVVYVGDMLLDIEVARRAGVAAYAIPTGSATRESLLQGRPDRLLHRFSDLLSVLPALSGR
jgi:phosphoglycolate phosphatase